MPGSIIERAIWAIVTVLLLIAAVNLATARRTEPQLGLWDADLSGRYQMPPQIALDAERIGELFRDKPLVLVPSQGESQSCRELFKYYGLDASRLERASRAGNPQGPCVPKEPITIRLDSDR